MALIPDGKGGFIVSGNVETGTNKQLGIPATNLSTTPTASTAPTPTATKPLVSGQTANSGTAQKIEQAQPAQQQQSDLQSQLSDINAKALKIKEALDKQTAPDGTIADASKVADVQNEVMSSLGSDKAISDSLAKLQADTQAYTNSTATTRVQDYQKLLDQQGIPGLQTQLVDMENIINGSEQDIRNEIQSGGGMATESQIQALTTARNKNLILRYNGLQNLLASKEAMVDKIVALSGEDRKDVSDRLNAQLGLDEKQLQMNIDLQKSKATEDLAFQRFIQSSQNTATTKAMEIAKAGGLTGASPEYLQQLSDNTGGLITPENLKQINDYAVSNNTAKLNSLLVTLATKQEAVQASGGIDPKTGMAVGVTGSSKVDASAPGYTTAAIQSAGGLTQATIDKAALLYATTGTMPSIGLGSTGSALMKRNAIMNRAAELDATGNIAAHKAELAALSKTLSAQTLYATQTERSLTSAEQGLEHILGTFKAKGINDQNLTVANIISNATKYQLNPEDIAAFRASLVEVGNEYSQVFSRGGQRNVQADQRAQDVINGDISLKALSSVGSELQAQGKIVLKNANASVDKVNSQINNIVSSNPSDTSNNFNSPQYNEDLAKTTVINYGKSNPGDQQMILDLTSKVDPTLGRTMTYAEVAQYLQEIGKLK